MNILPFDKQVAAISALTEGVSIRATERLTGIHRDTVMRLGARVGRGCASLHDGMMRGLHVNLIEMDETWAYVGKKQRRTTEADGPEVGDQYTFLALDSINKAIIGYRVGKRDGDNTRAFLWDLRERVTNVPQVSSDAFPPYAEAMREIFGGGVHYGQIVKRYVGEPPINAARRYSPGVVVGVEKSRVLGKPVGFQISTSMVERSNLTLRMQQRRFTRLTNGFSKKLDHHKAAVGLFVAHYNLCRVHESLRMTPAMAIGVADHIWTIRELIETVAAGNAPTPQGRWAGPFRVINGGVS